MKVQTVMRLLILCAILITIDASPAFSRLVTQTQIATGTITDRGTDGSLTLDNSQIYHPALGVALPELHPGMSVTLRYYEAINHDKKYYTEFAPGLHTLAPQTIESTPLSEKQ